MKFHQTCNEQSHDVPRPTAELGPQCPLCAGELVLLRDGYRCVRCCYSFCLGCDAAVTLGIE
jgi:hypothetical protein